jgi:hypothetical protein
MLASAGYIFSADPVEAIAHVIDQVLPGMGSEDRRKVMDVLEEVAGREKGNVE